MLIPEEALKSHVDDYLLGMVMPTTDKSSQDALSAINAVGDVANVVATTKLIASSSGALFNTLKGGAKQERKIKSLAASVKAAISIDYDKFDTLFPHSELNPYFRIFKKQVQALGLNLLEEHKLLHPVSEEELDNSTVKLNQFVDKVRQAAKEQAFVKEIRHHARNSNKNQASLNAFIDKLFYHKSKLRVIRVDLEYGREHRLDSDAPITYQETVRHREVLLNDLRVRLYKGSFVGYVWKLEYGLMNTFHYHMLIFLDASKVRGDINAGWKIGRHWEEVVTEGKGRYWNCNANKSSYRECGIGEIPHSSPELMANLKKAASYLVKADYYIRSAIPEGGRAFGKGAEIPKVKSNRGRPRGK
ncbi:YagK/YfjJ domain-containing protein [Pseudomonas sp. DSP3-2-2]|uniref:YagK/YfjJ domain-containing protein n=1 Tax=unclassified Pseudomonas TaxID=196821 RepID=UPI003CEA90BC